MKIAALVSASSWYLSDLQRAAAGQHEIVPLSFMDLSSWLHDEGEAVTVANVAMRDFSAVLVRTMPPGSLEQVVFRMDLLGRLQQSGVIVLNPPKAIEVAVDKYLSLSRLRTAGLTTPDTLICQTVEEAMRGFELLGRNVVVKPLFGSEGRGMTRIDDENIALRIFKALAQVNSVIYLQRFIEHVGFDLRVLLLGDKCWTVRRRNASDWRTNVSRGATMEAFDADEELVAMAREAAVCVGVPFAGVDVLLGRDGRRYILEVNAVPGWKALSHTLQVDIAEELISHLKDKARSDCEQRGR